MKKRRKPVWLDNDIQFPRLLAEIRATWDVTPEQYRALADSMDLDPERIDELFDRAQDAWERIKARRR